MYQPYPSRGQPTGPLRPAAPAPVLTAVKLMYAGAAVSIVPLIVALAYRGDIRAYHISALGHRLTAAQIIQWRPLIITAVIVAGLVVPGRRVSFSFIEAAEAGEPAAHPGDRCQPDGRSLTCLVMVSWMPSWLTPVMAWPRP